MKRIALTLALLVSLLLPATVAPAHAAGIGVRVGRRLIDGEWWTQVCVTYNDKKYVCIEYQQGGTEAP